MPKIEFTVDSHLSPDAVMAAATDFSERRLRLWPNISPKLYQVHSLAETNADVTEGSQMMGSVWARERYDWSSPGIVRATVQESNIFHPGGIWQMTVAANNGGSRITILNHRQPKGFKGKMAGAMMSVIGKGFLTKSLKKTLDLAASEAQPGTKEATPA